MASRHLRRPLLALGLVAAALACALTVAGLETGLLFCAPALVFAVPLIVGRYVGEERVVALATARRERTPRAVRRICARLPRAPRAIAARGGRLLADALAERGPPVLTAR